MDYSPFLLVLVFSVFNSLNAADVRHPMENEGMFEGDIAGIDPYVMLDRNAVVDPAELWPGGIVYYEIDRSISFFRDDLLDAMEEFHNKTCIRFRRRTFATQDYITFKVSVGCWSAVGRQGGEQEISLSEGCHDRVSAIHEMGHALGLWHEHSRSDRDDYLEILWDNIKPVTGNEQNAFIDFRPQGDFSQYDPFKYFHFHKRAVPVIEIINAGSEHNFLKLKPWENNLLDEEFDYKSIMLYGEYAFAKDRNSMTMRPRKEGVVIGLINLKTGLSDSDTRRLNKLYECFENVRPPPPDVPDFKCDFEKDYCDMENQNTGNANWERTVGTLGGRTGFYLVVNAADASFRRVRLTTPIFGAYGRKHGCLAFDTYFNGDGALHLNVMIHDINTSRLLLKHVEKSDQWQKINLDVALEKNVKVSIDAQTRKSAGDGVIAIDNFLFKVRKCDE